MKKSISIIIIFFSVFTAMKSAAQSADSLKITTIKVANLHCNNDMPTIKKQLQNQDGIDEISFTAIKNEQSVFTISYHTSAIDRQQIEKVIESTPGCDDAASRPYKVKKEVHSKNKNK